MQIRVAQKWQEFQSQKSIQNPYFNIRMKKKKTLKINVEWALCGD